MSLRVRARHLVKALVDEQPYGTMLDLGCGEGYLAIEIAQRNAYNFMIGLDRSIKNLQLAKTYAKHNKASNIAFVRADARFTPFSKGAFERILCSEVIEHIQEDYKVFTEVARVLKPMGVLVLTTPHKTFDKYLQLSNHIRSYTIEDLENELSDKGIEVTEFNYLTKSFGKRFIKLVDTPSTGILSYTRTAIIFLLSYTLSALDELLSNEQGLIILCKGRKRTSDFSDLLEEKQHHCTGG